MSRVISWFSAGAASAVAVPHSGARPMRELIRALLDALTFPFPEFPTEDDVP